MNSDQTNKNETVEGPIRDLIKAQTTMSNNKSSKWESNVMPGKTQDSSKLEKLPSFCFNRYHALA